MIIGLLSVLAVSAGTDGKRLFRRTGCVEQTATRADATRGITTDQLRGDVCIPIILAAYSDVAFTVPDVQKVWDAMANEPGFAGHGAHGSMADYFREQSYGKFRVTFDVLGPVTLPQQRSFYGKGSSDSNIQTMIYDACTLAAAMPGADFSRYDWNGDGTVETVLVVYAGIGENVSGAPSDVVWPKQGYVSSYSAGGLRLNAYACANELVYPDNRQEGFGTLLHEFSHCLGLPDLYNTSYSVDDYIIFDEWDLMDGGCYSADGWGPVGYSAYERMLCGWLNPEELTAETEVKGMKALTNGGGAYLVRSEYLDEFFLLENRQQTSTDYYLPGHGLLVTHVGQYRPGSSNPNYGSSVTIHPVPADNLEFKWSYKKYVQDYYGVTLPDNELNISAEYKSFLYDEEGRSRLMTGTAYPYVVDGVVMNDELTDTSTPAATLRYANSSGEKLLSKPITEISENDSLISFHFMAPLSAVSEVPANRTVVGVYDLYGRQHSLRSAMPHGSAKNSLFIIRYNDGTIKKMMK